MFWTTVEVEFTFKTIHRHAAFRIEHYERLHRKPHRKVVRFPNATLVLAWRNDLQCTDPTHHTSQVANKYMAWHNLVEAAPHARPKTSDVCTSRPKLVPSLACK